MDIIRGLEYTGGFPVAQSVSIIFAGFNVRSAKVCVFSDVNIVSIICAVSITFLGFNLGSSSSLRLRQCQ